MALSSESDDVRESVALEPTRPPNRSAILSGDGGAENGLPYTDAGLRVTVATVEDGDSGGQTRGMRPRPAEVPDWSDEVDDPVDDGSTLSSVLARRVLEGVIFCVECCGDEGTAWSLSCLSAGTDEDPSGVDTGKRIRWGVGVENCVGESGPSMVIPVVLGDNGEAMIGAGMVCRFNIGGVV